MKRATLGTIAFFFLAPGTVAGLVPGWLSGWERPAGGLRVTDVVGGVLVTIGLAVVIAAFAQFAREGRGTPAPVAPTEQLVVGGLYRYVRNPMYLAVAAIIGGQALIFQSGAVLGWLVAFMVLVLTFVTAYEQPTLRRTYGASYEAYCDAVPGWFPRLTPWRG
jgi:protein-S-isoprenylcysteine O-methyltransferase Ste14